MRKLKLMPRDKRGQLGLDTVKAVFIAFLILSVIAVAIILALVSLRDSSIFTDDSLEQNQTSDIISNISTGLTDFFDDTSVIFSILVVVVIILAIAIIIFAVSKFGGRGAGL